MVKSDDRSVSRLRKKIPEEVWREVFRESLESMSVAHTESPQTTPEKPQTVDRVHVEPSSRPLSDVDKEYGTDKNRGLELLSTVAVLVAEYEAKEDKSKKEEPRAYSGPINKEEEKFKERVLSLWVKKFEQRSITSLEPVQQNPNLDSESSPSSSVSQSKKSRPNKAKKRGSRKKRKLVGGLEVEPLRMTPPEWLVNVMREENGYNPKLISIKQLFMSDLQRLQARLSIPFKKVENTDFLTEEETRTIDQQARKMRQDGESVVLVDPQMNRHVLNLRKWQMGDNWYYAFVDGWNNVVAANMFKVDDVFPLWSFRSGSGRLCFALVPPSTTHTGQGGITSEESGQGNSLPGGDGVSTSGESGYLPLSKPPSPPARDSSFSGQGCSGESSSCSP